MASNGNKIGLRRLFDALGCSLSNRDELNTSFAVAGPHHVQIYLGPKPLHGIQVVSDSQKYIVPGDVRPLGTFEIKSDASESSYPRSFFLEISVSTDADETTPGADAEATRKELLEQARAKKTEFQGVIDLVSGMLGLRYHRQFVLELLDEIPFAWHGVTPIRSHAGPVWETLEELALNENGIAQLEAHGRALEGLSIEASQKVGLIFHWLLRSWRESDSLYRFVALFIPLEAILAGIKPSDDNKIEKRKRCHAIRKIIRSNGGDQREELLQYFDRVAQRGSYPTLDERFVALAESAKLPGWEIDIQAFRQFHRTRNALVHRGEKSARHQLSVGEDELRTLSDLVERYVSYVVFGDAKVYQSRWRPDIHEMSAGDAAGRRVETDG